VGPPYQIVIQMIRRIFRKLKFMSLHSGVNTFEQFKKMEPFDQLDSKVLDQNMELLRPHYEQYIREISRADMAASLELAAFIFTICKINKFTKLLDMGSGLSSFVYRLYAKETPGVIVYSVDDDAAWLEKTKDFLRHHELDTQNMFTLDQFLKSGESEFDCILHDLNFVEVRINYVEQMMKITKINGIIIFDDVHKTDYLFALLVKLKETQSRVFTLKPVTNDSYGRFALAVVKE